MKNTQSEIQSILDNLPNGVRLVDGVIIVGPEKLLTFGEQIRKVLGRLADSLENEK